MSATVGIDIGGTFTDVVLMADDGSVLTTKAPTTPDRLFDGLLQALGQVAELSGITRDQLLEAVGRIAHGTTAATNAYIERRGARVALLTTRGFEDTLFMQRMLGMTAGLTASELTDYSLRQVPEPLVERAFVFGVRERIDYRGDVIGPLQEDDVRSAASAIRDADMDAIAVSYLWSFKNHDHERRTAEILREELPDIYLSISSELVPRLGEYERTATTVINAYLGPLVKNYTDVLERQFGARPVVLLDSAGGVMTPGEAGRAPIRLLLSGPAGGVTGSTFLGGILGHRNVITFDMGGTSTDVSLIVDGQAVARGEVVAGKYHLLLSMIDIRTIGAGGGSIARVEDGGYLRVGPQSAGAVPGPACYGRGGELPTVTDADLILGIIDPERFLGGRLKLDVESARNAIDRHIAKPLGYSVEDAAVGIKRIVDNRMADLLRTVTIEQGHDPAEFALYAFGGAGATHAPAFALDVVNEVVIPATQSVHCAFGAIASDVTLKSELSAPMRITRDSAGADVDPAQLEEIFSGLEERARAALLSQGVATDEQDLSRIVEVRFTRQTKTLSVPYPGSVPHLVADFLTAYGRRYGAASVPELSGFELVTFAVDGRGTLPRPSLPRYPLEGSDASQALLGNRRVHDPVAREFTNMPLYDGERLRPGNTLTGPAIVEYEGTTVALPSGQRANVDELLNIVIRREG